MNNAGESVYVLLTELCKHLIEKHKSEEHPYLPRRDESGRLKKMRSRAFEILLNKSSTVGEEYSNGDPIVELLKYTFVLKKALRRHTRAEELEKCIDQLQVEDEPFGDVVYSVLTFLNGLKSFERKNKNALEVFHYGKPHPYLPEQPRNPKEVPRYQIYPVETFDVSERFEAMIGISSNYRPLENGNYPLGTDTLEKRFKSTSSLGIETLSTRSERTIGSMLSAQNYMVRLVSTREFSLSSHFIPQIADEDDNDRQKNYARDRMGFFHDPGPPWLCVKSFDQNSETNSNASDDESSNTLYNERALTANECLDIWDEETDEWTRNRTWETLGRFSAPKEPPFITETANCMLHIERITQAGILLLLPPNIVGSMNMIAQVSTRQFMENMKLLLLGVESSTFIWIEKEGFKLRKNTILAGLSAEALESACVDVTYWGECYRYLCKLVKVDAQTGKMQQEGLIFHAMCNSVKELLLYYQAVVLRFPIDNEDCQGLLKFLSNVKPVGSLMAEVARLCLCERNNRELLGEGLGILSHIYEQVTRITRPNVALVFYSILKSCCEVYFRMLEKWLFQGIWDDGYGEFMIKMRPQFVRDKGHRFWTKAFAINENSVPGFIAELTEWILQCGKTVRLLKICDPKNPIIEIFENSSPSVRVCLSVGMVREQELLCREYMKKGEELLGRNISFGFAIEEQKIVENERAARVMKAQRDTLERIKHEREKSKVNEARNKRAFLAQLKDQAEEAVSRKEREKEAELQKDKEYLENMNAADEIAKSAIIAEKQNTLDYYNELAAEVERRKTRADWRAKRMKSFEDRARFIESENRKIREEEKRNINVPLTVGKTLETVVEKIEDPDRISKKSTENPEATNAVDEKIDSDLVTEDMNKNLTELPPSEEKQSNEIFDQRTKDADGKTEITIIPKKSPRPCVLDIKKTTADPAINDNTIASIRKNINLQIRQTENMTDSQRNKLRVLEEEYGMIPNNNQFDIIVLDSEGNENTISIDATTISNKNLSKNHFDEMNCNGQCETDPWPKPSETNASKNRKEDSPAGMTEAQKNRRRNMEQSGHDEPSPEESSNATPSNMTDLQKNRARVMGLDYRNYRDSEEINVAGNCFDLATPMSQNPDTSNGLTPMSCTTDTFPTSISSSFVQLNNCEDSVEEGKSIVDTPNGFPPSSSNSNYVLADNNNSSSKFFSAQNTATPIFNTELTINDVEMIDNTTLQVYLEKSVAIPLRVQCQLANAAMVKYLIYECRIMSHLRSLRSFFFLLNGEFAKSLMNSLYQRLYEISVPIELFGTSTLTRFLETALNSSLCNSYENSKSLSLSAIDIPTQLQVSNPEFLNCLCLNYKISWPLNIIIDEKILQQYSKVFKFLLMVGRVQYVLQQDFNILKVERKATISAQYHKLQLYRHSMMQFVTALHNYLTCSVLHESWTEFEKELLGATTIDEIYLTHVSYIKKILSRCMLTSKGEKMRTFLCNIFKIILKFHNRVRSQNWSSTSSQRHVYSKTNFDRLENMYKTFCDARTYLAHVANKLASSGYQPHLTHFLNALNINPLYDLATMPIVKDT